MIGKTTDGNLTISIRDDCVHIEVIDDKACVRFLDIEVDHVQFVMALSRLAHVPCKMQIHGIDKIGRVQKTEQFSVLMPDDSYEDRDERARALIKELCPGGWEADLSLNSQDTWTSITGDDGVVRARATTLIRTWINPECEAIDAV